MAPILFYRTMPPRPPIELFVAPGRFGLASLDLESLRIMTYMKMAEIPYEERHDDNTYHFPTLTQGQEMLSDYDEVVEYLEQNFCSIDFWIGKKVRSGMTAYSSVVIQLLEPVLLYLIWMDDQNFMNQWFIGVSAAAYLSCRKAKHKAHELIKTYYPEVIGKLPLRNALRESADECFEFLSMKLKDTDYFYGKRPSSIDATIYTYLAPILKIRFPYNRIQKSLETYPRLVKFVELIDVQYFPELVTSTKSKLAGLGIMFCALLGYAYSTELIKFPFHIPPVIANIKLGI